MKIIWCLIAAFAFGILAGCSNDPQPAPVTPPEPGNSGMEKGAKGGRPIAPPKS